MEDIVVLDDFLPVYLQDQIIRLCYGVPWYLSRSSLFGNLPIENDKKSKDLYYDYEQFVYMFWDARNRENVLNYPLIDYKQYIEYGHYFSLPLQIAALKNNITFNLKDNFVRGKANLSYNNNNPSPIPRPPHRDMDDRDGISLRDKWAVIYYVDNSDGDTIIYNEKEIFDDYSKYTIKQSISPKKGRIVFLRGDLFHSSSVPSIKHSKRIIINYNLSIY